MPTITLPDGHTADIRFKMREFRDLWRDGTIQRMQALTTAEGGDLGEFYPVLARVIRSWNLVDDDGQVLDPTLEASYDELDPSQFMALVQAVSGMMSGGETAKN